MLQQTNHKICFNSSVPQCGREIERDRDTERWREEERGREGENRYLLLTSSERGASLLLTPHWGELCTMFLGWPNHGAAGKCLPGSPGGKTMWWTEKWLYHTLPLSRGSVGILTETAVTLSAFLGSWGALQRQCFRQHWLLCGLFLWTHECYVQSSQTALSYETRAAILINVAS